MHRACGVGCLRAHLEVLVDVQGPSHVGPGRGVVVGDQDPPELPLSVHNVASTWLPSPGVELTCSSPPTARARSCIDLSPKPGPEAPASKPRPESRTRSRMRSRSRSKIRLA